MRRNSTRSVFDALVARRRVRKREEQQLQQAVAKFLDNVLLPEVMWTAIGHGGGGATRGAILKGMGLKPGWPDIIVATRLLPDVLGIELKAKDGVLSKEQKKVHEGLRAIGWRMTVCRSIEEVAKALDVYGIPCRPFKLVNPKSK